MQVVLAADAAAAGNSYRHMPSHRRPFEGDING